ncbi:hypothetical protein BBJ28_00003317 [Nothophytophthora sp. Chile5]|nr:hypothetical protein BBJ28_00003317 [Nothophytophthora sp. Chile5]
MGNEQSQPTGGLHISDMYVTTPPRKRTSKSKAKSKTTHSRTSTDPADDFDSRDSVRSALRSGSSRGGPTSQRGVPPSHLSRSHAKGAQPARSQSMGGLWEDEAITTARIPLEKVTVKHLISRGGYGEVYLGVFKGKKVAVKMLLPETRKSVKHVNDFLAEVKLMAMMDHPRIVQFVGVAWESLSDLCAVSEYMEGGDLRALLVAYKEQGLPTGFDYSKATIALHVVHALTYLHSLDPPVVHRDLKSKNILLNAELDAKLTDFGVSRERVDSTMTAGVGTSLWMAPEVMMGEKYDEKADIFSFGVVLSELDMHVLPYSNAKENSDTGRKLPDTAILQMVLLGKLRVEFSKSGPKAMVALCEACVAMDPKKRPTAAEALYKLQTILANDMQDVEEPEGEARGRADSDDRESEASASPDADEENEGGGVTSAARPESPTYVF